MKKLFFGSIAIFALTAGGPVAAADMPARAPVYKAAPAYVPAFSWNGCYIGAHGGYGWGRNKSGLNNLIDGSSPDFAFEHDSLDHNANGAVAGGQIGCNYQAATNWVVGIEGELWWSGMKGTGTSPEDGCDPGCITSYESRNRWDGDVALRVGYAWDRSLLYGKVGAAWGGFRYTIIHDDFGSVACSCQTFSKTLTGLLLGVGWEYAFTNNWTFKVEYNHIDFGSRNLTYLPTGGGVDYSNKERKDIVKVGVNYLFGGVGKGPLVARY